MADRSSTIPKDDTGKGLDGMNSASKAEGSGQPSQTSESCSDSKQVQDQKRCPPHDWVVVSEGEDPDTTIAKNNANAQALPAKKADQARGYLFEVKAIEANKKRGIKKTSRKLQCRICKVDQELDIVFNDGQIGECSSKKAKKVADGKRDQAKRQKEIQVLMNKESGKEHKPLAKIDGSLADATGKDSAQAVFERREYQVEVVT